MILKKEILVINFFVLSIIFTQNIFAGIIKVGSCAQASVQAAVNSALPGDTISLPEGDATWSTPIKINTKQITLKGSGIGSTVITGSGQMIVLTGESANNLRITGIEMRKCYSCIHANPVSSQTVKDIRIDHCKFVSSTYVYETHGGSTGVIDHCNFVDSYAGQLYGSNSSSLIFPVPLGTADAVFFEDNQISVTANGKPQHFIASNSGSKYVVRHNVFDYKASLWDIIDAHGYCEVQGRGSATWEVYANTFNLVPTIDRVINLRGGQGVVYDNVFNGYNPQKPITLTNYQTCIPPCVAPVCSTYPCKDQINHSYFWNNKTPKGAVDPTNSCSILQLNRDYFTTKMPDYTPYTYPHPLTLAGTGEPVTSVKTKLHATNSMLKVDHKPFSAVTSVSYVLDHQSPVSIGVYNVNGSLVENLVNETQSAGKHSLVWNAPKSSKSFYILRVKIGNISNSFKVSDF